MTISEQLEDTIFSGENLTLTIQEDRFARLLIETPASSMNVLNAGFHADLRQVLEMLKDVSGLRGLMLHSGRTDFVAGADIGEFGKLFATDRRTLVAHIQRSVEGFSALEDLPVPTVAAVRGMALGGGLELAMACDARVLEEGGSVGLPEVSLGLIPGLGGTVRLPRLIGIENALKWITSGAPVSAEKAVKLGLAEEVAPKTQVEAAAMDLLRRLAEDRSWGARRAAKKEPLEESMCRSDIFDLARQGLRSAVGQPAAGTAIDLIEQSCRLPRAGAQSLETEAFATLAQTQGAKALSRRFVSERNLRRKARDLAGQVTPPRAIGVLGAGIMGGGIAYNSARQGVPARIRDIAEAALDGAAKEVDRLSAGELQRGRLDAGKAEALKKRIALQLTFEGFDRLDLIIEAIVEKLEVKQKVLSELEMQIGPDRIIATNTSSLRIDDIAAGLTRPENLVGMHFFNPVPLMPLVEIVRGSATSDRAVAVAVAQALAMKKLPLVVQDCPGFLVNRIFTAYINAFTRLVSEGVSFQRIDAVMERFGWPMGPAYLEDVIGLDTGAHVIEIISAGYPERMARTYTDAVQVLCGNGRLGQKSGGGFYDYVRDEKGRLRKQESAVAAQALAAAGIRPLEDDGLDDAEIIRRIMIPTLVEAAHAIEEGVAESAEAADMALLTGLGFPAYLGGIFGYADWIGSEDVVAECDRLSGLGAQYATTERMREFARDGKSFLSY